ncbi:MAG TPA: DUF2905 domain-containing protein [Porphyromonadaceae bacterium]|jgi:uncharacterized protein HemY|uniref:DUF2905 domain-containing protein n=1 Tax=Limibacterium fermenti TaxID=3229863 RepID=UPI000E9CCBE2|nr:DUF2905 domain-containing protein [Porphyromonadaceae bacterium]HBK30458.1 DUF2905 domain-containing protein [Porphyromonadaceae bacterium]HBL32573.1 DUF2905 domain-containing protein [Porphyromonadaceae bacterium]HBX21454.1 DUF2905 domain-containing protein [Porphyromonadaceae bacterium]HBX44914.1 DUF2905 domain-containing protein [Porphyromonadaceae bacterium]
MQEIGKILIDIGIILLIVGIILAFFGDKLSFLGRLPGDIRIEKENFRFYFPITTTILISVFVSLLIWLIRQIGGK